jgi:cob(I)alamin adenosyltransferase
MNERHAARGEYEELREKITELSTPLFALHKSISNKTVATRRIDVQEIMALLTQIDKMQIELDELESKAKDMKEKWGFK